MLYSFLNPLYKVRASPALRLCQLCKCFQVSTQRHRCLLTRAPGGAQGTLLAPGLAVLAAAFCVCGAMAMQGLAAYIIGDFFPANVHVDVMVRQVLWGCRGRA